MRVLKDILGGSLEITPEISNNLARQKIASKESLGGFQKFDRAALVAFLERGLQKTSLNLVVFVVLVAPRVNMIRKSGIKMTGVSKTSLLIFAVFARFLALTAEFWQVNDHRKGQEQTMNQSKTTLFRSRNLKGLVFLSPEKNPRVCQIFVRDSGAGNGCANFMDAWKKSVRSAGKTMSIKFLVLRGGGGYFRFWGGGVPIFIFMGARIFLIWAPTFQSGYFNLQRLFSFLGLFEITSKYAL